MPANTAITRPEDVLPDGQDRAEIAGVTVRKGTVAAFVRNVQSWSDPATDAAARTALLSEIEATVPALQALGVLEVFTLRDPELRARIERS